MDKKWHRMKPLPQDIAVRLAQLPSLLAAEGVQLAYLFGSLAQQTKGNDVDLALLMPPDQLPYRLRDKLTTFLKTERLDIVDLRRANNVLRFEIISSGRCLYASDDDQKQDFELETVRVYHDREIPRRRQEAILRERMKWLSNAGQ
jgi:predicted nucleotidyltransferase